MKTWSRKSQVARVISVPCWTISIFLFFISVRQVVVCRRIVPIYKTSRPPMIWLSGYSLQDDFKIIRAETEFKDQTQFENEFISKNGKHYVFTDNEVRYATFICQANYPIKWTAPFPEHFISSDGSVSSIATFRGSKFSSEMHEPKTQNYTVLIILSMYGFLSANLTCEGMSAEGVKQSESIYVLTQGYTSIEREGKTIPVTRTDLNKPIILPCRTSSLNASVQLEKQFLNRKKMPIWKRIHNIVNFDPKIGFTFPPGVRYGYNINGLYRCTVKDPEFDEDENNSEFIYFNVTTPTDWTPPENIHFPYTNLRGKAKIIVEPENVENKTLPYHKVMCCSGVPDLYPKMYKDYCYNKAVCDFKQDILLAKVNNGIEWSRRAYYTHKTDEESKDGCTTIKLYYPPVLIGCKVENMEYLDLFIELFSSAEANISFSISDTDIMRPDNSINSVVKAATADLPEKLLLSLARLVASDGDRDRPNRFRIESTMRLSSPEDVFIEYEEFIEGVRRKPVVLEEFGNELYEGEQFHVTCVDISYFYSFGSHLRVTWSNGTKSPLTLDMTTCFYLYLSQEIQFKTYGDPARATFSIPIEATLNMESVECFVPLENSDKWDTISRKLNVLQAMPPVLSGLSEETVYFNVRDTNMEITICKLKPAAPSPSIAVTKDGKEIEEKTNTSMVSNNILYESHSILDDLSEIYNGTLIKIQFSQVTHDIAGVYICSASNVKGNATRTVRVFVTDSGNATLAVLMSGIIIMFVLALGVFIKLRYCKQAGYPGRNTFSTASQKLFRRF